MQTYVAGFMIEPTAQDVLLIKKNRPDFQAGKWNGIGGKIEPLERPLQAMVREFREETGIDTQPEQWEHTIDMSGEDFCVSYFRTFVDTIPEYQQMTDERVATFPLNYALGSLPTLFNLKWILPLQFTRNVLFPLHIWWEREGVQHD